MLYSGVSNENRQRADQTQKAGTHRPAARMPQLTQQRTLPSSATHSPVIKETSEQSMQNQINVLKAELRRLQGEKCLAKHGLD
jgi:hypothetical protein